MKRALIGITAFTILTGVVGTTDINTFNGIHSVKGTVTDEYIITDNGSRYKVSDFQSGSNVTVELDKQGNVISVVCR